MRTLLHLYNFGEVSPGGAVIFEMDTGVRPTLRQAGAFGESTCSKNEGSLGESMIFGIRWEKNPKICCLIGLKMRGHLVRARFFSFGEWNLAFGERKISKFMGSLGESTCDYKKMRGLWVTAMLKKGVFWALHTRHLQNGTAPPGEVSVQMHMLPKPSVTWSAFVQSIQWISGITTYYIK